MSERLKEIRGRLEKATPGPWKYDEDSCDCSEYGCRHPNWAYGIRAGKERVIDSVTGDGCSIADAEFIAHARQDIPFLLSELERVKRERDELAQVFEQSLHAANEASNKCCGSIALVTDERDRLRSALEVARNALQLVSSPKRDDGTYNRSREACERLAAEALAEIVRVERGKE